MTAPELKTLVGEYLAALEEQTQLQATAVGHLKGLSAAMASRNPQAMECLLKEADEAQQRLAQLEARRRTAGDRLAAVLRCRQEELTLKRLARDLPGPEGRAVEGCRRRLRSMIEEVRRNHLKAVAFLGECARLNRALLAGLFPDAGVAPTYGASGRSPACSGGGLLDARS
jgi:hypothetical protein